jgi:hypothetical protein
VTEVAGLIPPGRSCSNQYRPGVDSAALAATVQVLAAVLPGSTGLLPDQINHCTADPWLPLDLEAGDDVAVGKVLMAALGHNLGHRLLVVSEASWRDDVGPFTVTKGELPTLIMGHADRYQEPFFAGDVIIISPDNGEVVVVHHSGLMTAIHGAPARRI